MFLKDIYIDLTYFFVVRKKSKNNYDFLLSNPLDLSVIDNNLEKNEKKNIWRVGVHL